MLNVTKIWEAARATSAAGSFFDPIYIGDEGFVDGATGSNNPINEMWIEATDIWRTNVRWNLEDNLKCLVSIGTGIPTLKAFEDYAISIGNALVAIATDNEKVAETFQKHHSRLFRDNRAFRFNALRGLEDIGLEGPSKQGAIMAATRGYIQTENVANQLEACAQLLRNRECTSGFN